MSACLQRWLARWRDWLPLFLILVAGAVLRLIHIGNLPPGLYRDEAFYGLDALGVTRGEFALYFAANNGREGMFMYLLAPAIALLGRTSEALRVVSALVGVTTLIAIYAAGRALFSHRIGVLAAAILAVTFWHLAISRVAFRAILLPFWVCVASALFFTLLRDPRAGRPWLALLAGAAFGLTFYAYTSGQLIAVLFIGFLALVAIAPAMRNSLRMPRALWLGLLAGAVLTLAPLVLWLLRHPDLYFARAGQVSILSPEINRGDLPGALLGNVLKTVGMFAHQGDRIWRHNLSLRPVYTDWLAAAFFIGVVVCAWRVGRGMAAMQTKPGAHATLSTLLHPQSSVFVLLWLIVFLAPTILAEDAPHYLRAIGTLPAICLIAAIGLEAVLSWLSRRGLLNFYAGPLRRAISPPALLATLALIVSGVNTVSDYFGVYVHHPTTGYWLEDHNAQLAREVNVFAQQHGAANVWIDHRLLDNNPALRFLSPEVEAGRVTRVALDALPVAPANGANVLLLVDPNHDWAALREALPAGAKLSVLVGPLAQGDLDPAPRRAFIAVQAAPKSEDARLATFEQGIVLRGAQVSLPAGALNNVYTITLHWSVLQPVPEDLAVFVHWMRDGQLIAQHDSSPAEGYLPMPAWRAGDVIVDAHAVTVPAGYQPGDTVRVGIYRRETGRRLAVWAEAAPTAQPEEWVDLTALLTPLTP